MKRVESNIKFTSSCKLLRLAWCLLVFSKHYSLNDRPIKVGESFPILRETFKTSTGCSPILWRSKEQLLMHMPLL